MTSTYFSAAKTLVLKERISAKKFSDSIDNSYTVHWQKSYTSSLIFLDSFDGRLFRNGYTMVLSDQRIHLISAKDKSQRKIKWPKRALPGGAEDFSDANVRNLLEDLLAFRNLSRILSLKMDLKPFSILNSDDKTIARGYYFNSKSNFPELNLTKNFICISPLRGYSNEASKIQKSVALNASYTDLSKALLSEYNIELKDYSKPSYNLTSSNNISHALFEILSKNYLIIRKNEKGIIDDIDIEFLHDYRVACRRMRSALSLIKNVLDPVVLEMLKLDLKYISRYSGTLRDLDVYLLREQEYRSLLPAEWPQQDIHAIFVKLKRQRQRAYHKMTYMLKSREYVQLNERWQGFLGNYEAHIKSDAPLKKTASGLIMKWFMRIIKDGRVLSSKDPDEKFHELRIKCKKLRYLLEFFGPLYPVNLINRALRQLKKLQENLGEFNDYSVQIETLNLLLKQSVKKPTDFVKTIAGLVTVLEYKMHQLRDAFYTLFAKFSSSKNVLLYKKIFGN